MTWKILCVDDEESITTLVTRLLNAKGHTVTVARGGGEALVHATAAQIDAIITDHVMSGMTGVELVRHLRAAAYPGRIFVLSGALSAESRGEYEALQVDAIAAKPGGLKEILALIEQR